LPGLFYVLALLGTGDAAPRKEALAHVRAALGPGEHPLRGTYLALDTLLGALLGETTPAAAELSDLIEDDRTLNLAERLVAARRGLRAAGPSAPRPDEPPSLDTLGRTLCVYWLGRRQPEGRAETLEELCGRAEAGGYRLVEAATAELLETLGRTGYAERAARLGRELGLVSLTAVVTREEPWERTLGAALALFAPGAAGPGAGGPPGTRLAWLLSWQGKNTAHLRPVEQKRSARGEWSAGRNVALKRLKESAADLGFLTPQDYRVCAAIQSYGGGYWDRPSLVLDGDRALRALVGHPLVFLDGGPVTRVEVLRGEPELRVVRKGRQLTLRVVPEVGEDAEFQILRESPTRVRVVEFGPRARRLAELFGAKGLKVPVKAEERVRQVLAAVAAELTVHSDDAALGTLEELPADPRPRIHLLPAGAGLRAELLVQPLGPAGPGCAPGEGGRSLIAEVEGRRVATRRDLDAERRAAEAVVEACPALAAAEADRLSWTLGDPEDCLELLLQLQALGDAAVVEWPQGQTLKAPRRVALDALKLEFRREKDWFAAGGELRVDDSLTIGLRELLDLAGSSPGRFVPVGDGQFLALTQAFRRRLDELRSFTEAHGKGLRFHPLAAPALEECAAEAGSFRGDQGWKELVGRFAEAQALSPPVPATLAAELRPYQVDGYQWLMRLAHWGVGACLADDMGLGKTLQALALILTRARNGPCLVVAPTSVCPNWAAEAQRFAPTLRPIVFGPGDREKTLARLQPFDLVLTSYGLLLQEAERLSAVDWEVAVLDEAQAIKNVAAKRSQAAMELKAGVKVITTGTPVENHLGELWNLFRFVNPGLLGSRESFQRRFAAPIEGGDRVAQARLKRLISPFLLRRTKSQVLEDLPPRTEILHRVELGPEEAALYEALRGRAVERLAEWEGPPLAKRFQVLAELMRLRRACCHPRLVLPETAVPSAKLEAFGEILDELVANRHRALVFSQFVDHLTIVREYVESRGLSYQYLDGSTPARDRKRRVDAFQAGEGQLFLISLKAGGLGLNLTAADYVVHLDPWWNPAVEDQASDRAHRIGQTRPVTIYRLVARGTVEDKIVELHHKKRDLADSLLEDADGGGRLSAEDLLEILRGQ
ncbi:MAG: DEAD/DEAH box helicase, partial [Deferrisomatales bacterium]